MSSQKIIPLFTEENIVARYELLVDEFVKMNGAVDLARLGVEYASQTYPTDVRMAKGSIESLRMLINLLVSKLNQIRKLRVHVGRKPLPTNIHDATEMLYADHFPPFTETDDDSF